MNKKEISYNLKHFMKTNRLGTIGFVIVSIFIIVGVFAPWLAPSDPNQMNLKHTCVAELYKSIRNRP